MAGDAGLCERFEQVRAATLAREREPERVRDDVSAMRRRMRGELDRSDAALFDLKQGEGGLVDLEFLLQALVLVNAHMERTLLAPRTTRGLIESLQAAGVLDPMTTAALLDAHATQLALGLGCTLDRRPRRMPYDDALERTRDAIGEACRAHGLRFGAED